MRISDWSSDVCSSDLDRCKDRRIIFHFITYVAGSNGEDSEGQSQRTSNQKHACACQPLKGRSVDRHPVTQKEDAHQKEISLHIFGVIGRYEGNNRCYDNYGAGRNSDCQERNHEIGEEESDERSEEHTYELQSLMRNSYD